MPATLTTDQVWREVEKQTFAVLGFVTPGGEARTAGIVYAVRNREIYIVTGANSWKARHVAANPHVSLTVTIAKRIPFLPWIRIPAATISLQGEAAVEGIDKAPPEVLRALLRGLKDDPLQREKAAVIRVRPMGHFVTYGVGVSLETMRHPEAARGRVGV